MHFMRTSHPLEDKEYILLTS